MDQDKKFGIAMAVYAVLAVLAWMTMTNAGIRVAGNGISMRGLVWILLGFFCSAYGVALASRKDQSRTRRVIRGSAEIAIRCTVGEMRSERRNSASGA